MGHHALPALCARLAENGLGSTTPAAMIENGTLPGQRVIRGTLADLPAKVAASGLHGPALLIIGDVVMALERASAEISATVWT
jgi:siroheme synthase